MTTDPHMQALELSAGTVALKDWVQDQIANNHSLSIAQRLALGHIPDNLYGQIVTVVNGATDTVRDTDAPFPAQAQEEKSL